MKSDEPFVVVDGRGPAPLFIPQHIVDAINHCLRVHADYQGGEAEFSDTEIARLTLADKIIARALEAGVQVCQ